MDGKFLAFLAFAMATAFGGTWWYINREPSPDAPSRAVSPPLVTAKGEVVSFKDCDEVRAKGYAPLMAGRPGYTIDLDPDGDGIACPPTS